MKATFLKHNQKPWYKEWVYVLWIIHVVVSTCVSMYSLAVLVSLWILSHASCVCGCRLDAMVSMPCYFSPPFEREGHREREVTMRKRALFLFVTTLSLCPLPLIRRGEKPLSMSTAVPTVWTGHADLQLDGGTWWMSQTVYCVQLHFDCGEGAWCYSKSLN